jgi:two-component system chemotaxis sensor kinase CheA
MDVVKTNIAKLNGEVEVLTKKDLGSTFRISIPLTLAIIQALMVRIGKAQYAIPLTPIVEIIKITRKDLDNLVGQKALVIRARCIPFSNSRIYSGAAVLWILTAGM